eukprot:651124-Alexandrium_andersonii.AAC.1
MHELWKGKGDQTLCDPHRGILVADTAGKAFRNHARSLVEGPFAAEAKHAQFAGVNKRGTDLAGLLANTWWEVLRAHKWAGAEVYVDVIAAFYSVARPLVVACSATDAELTRLFQKLGVAPTRFKA